MEWHAWLAVLCPLDSPRVSRPQWPHHPDYTFIPASVGAYDYLGKPPVRYLTVFSEVAAARGPAVTKGSFLAGAHRELSVARSSAKDLHTEAQPTFWLRLLAGRCRRGLRSLLRTEAELWFVKVCDSVSATR